MSEPAALGRILDDAAALGDKASLSRLGQCAANRASAAPKGSYKRSIWGYVGAAFTQRVLAVDWRLKGNIAKAQHWEAESERSLERVFALTRGRN